MIVFSLLCVLGIGLFVIGVANIEYLSPLIGLGVLLLFVVIVSFFGIRSGCPNIEEYNKLNVEYVYCTNNIDSIPFLMKQDLYSRCEWFNRSVLDNMKYEDNIWIGAYYKAIDSNIKTFDLTKIK